jgi:hypothetical protein
MINSYKEKWKEKKSWSLIFSKKKMLKDEN